MSAVLSRDPGHHQYIPLTKLKASPLNHRKFFDEAKMAELTANIAAQGVIVPIIARPVLARADDKLGPEGIYEVVAGERRFRAAKAAKLPDIPAIIRELTDAQAIELQVIENQQRVDVLPLEEAEGYAALMKCTHPDGARYTVDEIAAKVGMSKSHVYQRLKLMSLCPAAREALGRGEIDASIAVLLARIPNDGLQRKALTEVVQGDYRGPMTYKRAQEHIREKYMLRLADAPFDVKVIYFKGSTAEALAPVCAECPKRTGNQVELFGDVADGDVCTDPSCFEAKRLAHVRRAVEEAEKAGRPVLRGEEAKAVLPNNWGEPKGGYIKLDDRCWEDEKQRTYRQILGKKAAAEHLVILERGKGEIVELVKTADVKPILKEKGVKAPASEPTFNTAEDRAARQREEEKRKREEIVNRRVHAAIYAKHPGVLGKAELVYLVGKEMEDGSLDEEQYNALGIGDDIDLEKLSVKDLTRLLVFYLIAGHYDGEQLADRLAKSLRIDVEKIKKAVAAEQKVGKAEPVKAAKK